MVIVGFQSRVQLRGLAWLKHGFRHCFAYQRASDAWVLCDPLSTGILLYAAQGPSAKRLITTLAALGASVVCIEPPLSRGPLPWLRPMTCVEICKRLAGRRGLYILTPYQLFKNLLIPPVQTL